MTFFFQTEQLIVFFFYFIFLLLLLRQYNQLEDATFQVYKDGDYGNYLDVEASLNEQAEELEGFLEK